MRIRTLEMDDYDFIIARVDDWWGGRDMSGGLPRFFFNHFAQTSLAAVDEEDRVIAFLSGLMSPDRPREAYIHYAAVDPDHQGRGIGKALYQAFFDLARSHGRSLIRCSTSPVNKDSVVFHQRMGFDLVASPHSDEGVPVHKDYNGSGRDKVLFVKDLDS